jgi:protein-tyrosine kinase
MSSDSGFQVAPSTVVSEEFRALKRRLLEDAEARTILVTSAMPGEGKSFVALNLALGFDEGSVVLVDADWHRHSLADQFRVAPSPGLSDLLADESLALDAVLHPTPFGILSFLAPGRPPSPGLPGRRLARRIGELASRDNNRSITIVDTPPVLSSPEAIAWAGHVARVVIVVQSHRTPGHILRRTLSLVQDCPKVDCVLNMAELDAVGLKGYG